MMERATQDLMFMAQVQRKFAPDTSKVLKKVKLGSSGFLFGGEIRRFAPATARFEGVHNFHGLFRTVAGNGAWSASRPAGQTCVPRRLSGLVADFPIGSAPKLLRALSLYRFADLETATQPTCPSPLCFDATVPKPEAKVGKSVLQRKCQNASHSPRRQSVSCPRQTWKQSWLATRL